MRNILVIDGANNATFSVFQATEDEFRAIFPNGQDTELIEDFIERVGDTQAAEILNPLWERLILKRAAMGIHGTLFYDNERRREHLPRSKREVDWDERAINQAQRQLFRASR